MHLPDRYMYFTIMHNISEDYRQDEWTMAIEKLSKTTHKTFRHPKHYAHLQYAHLQYKKKGKILKCRFRFKEEKVPVKKVKNSKLGLMEHRVYHGRYDKYVVKKKNIIVGSYYKKTKVNLNQIVAKNKLVASKLETKLDIFERDQLHFNNKDKIKLLLQYWVTKSPFLRNDLGSFIMHLKGRSSHIFSNAQNGAEYESNLNLFYSSNLLEEIVIRNYFKNKKFIENLKKEELNSIENRKIDYKFIENLKKQELNLIVKQKSDYIFNLIKNVNSKLNPILREHYIKERSIPTAWISREDNDKVWWYNMIDLPHDEEDVLVFMCYHCGVYSIPIHLWADIMFDISHYNMYMLKPMPMPPLLTKLEDNLAYGYLNDSSLAMRGRIDLFHPKQPKFFGKSRKKVSALYYRKIYEFEKIKKYFGEQFIGVGKNSAGKDSIFIKENDIIKNYNLKKGNIFSMQIGTEDLMATLSDYEKMLKAKFNLQPTARKARQLTELTFSELAIPLISRKKVLPKRDLIFREDSWTNHDIVTKRVRGNYIRYADRYKKEVNVNLEQKQLYEVYLKKGFLENQGISLTGSKLEPMEQIISAVVEGNNFFNLIFVSIFFMMLLFSRFIVVEFYKKVKEKIIIFFLGREHYDLMKRVMGGKEN